MPLKHNTERDAEIRRLRRVEKLTYKAIGLRYKISRQRIHRIINCESIPNVDAA